MVPGEAGRPERGLARFVWRPEQARWAGIAATASEATLRLLRGGLDFGGRVWRKAGDDDIFFLAGGIAFNVLLGAIPLFVLVVAVFAQLLQQFVSDPEEYVVDMLLYALPNVPRLSIFVRSQVASLISDSTQALSVSAVLVIWAATRMIGCLRSTLREVFDIPDTRGIVGGKIFDIKMVLVVGMLVLVGTSITVFLEIMHKFGTRWLGTNEELLAIEQVYGQLLAFAATFTMYLLIYRYLPARRIPWRTAMVSATFTATLWELLKLWFVWYVAHGGDYASAYGPLATAIAVVFWIYWSAVVFILGGEVGVVYDLVRIRHKQRELLD